MKRIILLVLILAVTPFLLESEKTLHQQVEEIRISNSKNPETLKWEYVKDRAFDEYNNLTKGYNKPVIIYLNEDATRQDSLFVNEYIKKLKALIPSMKIGLDSLEGASYPFHYVNLGFGSESFLHQYFAKQELNDGTIILRSRPGFVTTSDSSKHSMLDFNFKNTISDQTKRLYMECELSKAIFATKSTTKPYNKLFDVQTFNPSYFDDSFGFLGDKDQFLLQKVYSDDFLTQFEAYLNAYYPWRYAYSFLHKKNMELLAVGVVSLLGIIVFLLLFSLFQIEKFKTPFLNYYVPVVLIWAHLVNLKSIYTYLTDFTTVTSWGSSVLF
ncbi:MAG: hypothetical protein R3243_16970, partial [Arenibacter latericius]|nr:hypothetical protein [Arenibacter latericius]